MRSELQDLLLSGCFPAEMTDAPQLGQWIYENCYLRRFDVSPMDIQAHDLTPQLSAANRGIDRSHGGWAAVQMLDNGCVLAQRHGTLRTFVAGEFLAAGRTHGLGPQKDDEITVYAQRESLRVQPGLYHAFGEALHEAGSESTLRFYWNVRPESAPVLLETVTANCNRVGIPFQFKCPRDASGYGRRDAAVLYISARYVRIAVRAIARIHTALPADCLEAEVPLFTRLLAPGLGFAEDPANGMSFGEHRCRLLADAVLHRSSDDRSSDLALADRLAKRFEQEGLSGERPWLNPGSNDLDWPGSSGTVTGPRSARADGFLEVAERIGARLCRDAIWFEDRCTWTTDDFLQLRMRHVAMGSDVYGGTSGVAMFLARLAKATGDPYFQETARGAIRHAEQHSADRPTALYSGQAGILLAAAEVLGEEVSAARLLQAVSAPPMPGAHDLMSGEAGVIVALLKAWRESRGAGLLEVAIQKGDWLIAQADREEGDLSWSGGGGYWKNLTGYSHGAAGIGWALAELYGCSLQRRFADAALDAFRYERACFDPAERNWPDFRDEFREEGEASFGLAWCHGAPGIALSRLRAAQLIPEAAPLLHEDLRYAIETTKRNPLVNWSLCHGQAGNAEILLLAGLREEAVRVGEEGIERYDRPRNPWPCAIEEQGHEMPGLMTGLAGIGCFYLRLHDAGGYPSPLLWI